MIKINPIKIPNRCTTLRNETILKDRSNSKNKPQPKQEKFISWDEFVKGTPPFKRFK